MLGRLLSFLLKVQIVEEGGYTEIETFDPLPGNGEVVSMKIRYKYVTVARGNNVRVFVNCNTTTYPGLITHHYRIPAISEQGIKEESISRLRESLAIDATMRNLMKMI